MQHLKNFNKKHNLKLVFILGGIIGGIIFILLFGIHILDGNYVDRLLIRDGVEDLPQHYLAWEYFRRSAWSFPLGNIENLIYPDSISIVYSDSIPIFAVIFKIFSPILPVYFQYFGIWTLLCFILQGSFAALISYKFSKSKVISLVFSIFFILSTVILKRAFYHSALAAHWLILAAFVVWFYKNEFKSRRQFIILFAVLNALTVVIEAYFTPLTLGIMFCCLLQDFMETRKWKITLATIGASFGLILLTAWVFGYFATTVSPATVGLGKYSFNLNGLFNPGEFSEVFDPMQFYLPGQKEGMAYLGLGIFILLGLSIIHLVVRSGIAIVKKRVSGTCIINVIPWIILVSVFTVLALSPTITFGKTLLLNINFPKSVYDLLSVFRSSGRFIWPVFYAIYIFCIYEVSLFYNNTLKKLRKKSVIQIAFSALTVLMLITLLDIQLYDISPLLKRKHNIISNDVTYKSPLECDAWKELAKTHKYIYIYSPTYDLYAIYLPQSVSLTLEKYALDNNLILNAAYLSRDISKEKDAQIAEHFNSMSKGAVYDDYIYIFPNPENVPGAGYGLHYYNINSIIVGVNTPIQGLTEIVYK